MLILKVEGMTGDGVAESIGACIRVARQLYVAVKITINEIDLFIVPRSNLSGTLMEYQEKLHAHINSKMSHS